MSRKEFTKLVKREALKRSGGFCEGIGLLYGLEKDQRCNANLSYGVNFDHVNLEANSHDNSLENCAATCPHCNQWKNNNHDTPRAAKTIRQRDKHQGIKTKKHKWQSRPFNQAPRDNTKYLDRT